MREKNNFLLTTHEKQDGDAAGSLSAFYHLLKGIQKNVSVVVEPPPRPYKFLYKEITWHSSTRNIECQPEVIVALDCADLSRIGDLVGHFPSAIIINIDHHYSNSNFGTINLVRHELSSTGEVLFFLAQEEKLEITPSIATALYTAIVTDTGRFTHKNTTSQVMRVAADLIDLGANPSFIAHLIWENKSFGEISLIARATNNIEHSPDGRLVWTTIRSSDYAETGTSPLDTHEFVNIPRALEGAKVAIFFSEFPGKEKVKASIRTADHIDANLLAKQFGGGGHRRAAGCQQPPPLELFKSKLLAASELEIKKAYGN